MKTIGELQLLPVWVNPNHRVSTAKIILAGHRTRALGVIEGGLLVGTIGFEELSAASDSDEIARYVRPLSAIVSPDERVRDVAARMAVENIDYMPVSDRGKFLGILTASMLLRDVSRSWDPLTGLSWSDALRDWGIQQLREGHEVTIIFIDLDDFGLYNKKYGHIVGDRVLIQVARELSHFVDDDTDVLVRYGGDEFAIGTLRTRRETETLLREIQTRIQGTTVPEADQPVTFSSGIFGGRRTKERENVHYSATLDSLINIASRAAQASKDDKKNSHAPEMPMATPPTKELEITVIEVFSSGESNTAMDTVLLGYLDRVASGVHTRGTSAKIESVVQAAAKALERLTEGLRFELTDVQLSECEQNERYITVSGRLTSNGEGRMVSASVRVGADLYRSAAEAAVEAVTS